MPTILIIIFLGLISYFIFINFIFILKISLSVIASCYVMGLILGGINR